MKLVLIEHCILIKLSCPRYKLSGVEHEEPGDKVETDTVGMDDLLQVQVLAGAQQIHLIQVYIGVWVGVHLQMERQLKGR